MYTLYYISESLQISTLEVETLDQEIIIPENLHFIALRKGINFINEPHECIDFTHLERLAIAQRLDDLNLFQNHPFRLKNSKLSPLCQMDPNFAMNFKLGKGESHLALEFDSNKTGFEITENYNDPQMLPFVGSVFQNAPNKFIYVFHLPLSTQPQPYKDFILKHIETGKTLKFIYPDISLVGRRDEPPYYYIQPV